MKPKSIGEKLNIVIESLEQVTRTGVYVDYILEVSLFTVAGLLLSKPLSFSSLIPLFNSW